MTIRGSGFPVEHPPEVKIGGAAARVAFASSSRLVIIVPPDAEGGLAAVRVGDTRNETASVSIGTRWATGLHQVDNPVVDSHGNVFVTYSGSRGQETPISIFRVTRAGTREPFSSGIVNATSMAIGPDGDLYVSSRFEGAVYRVDANGVPHQIASDLGVACGLAFDEEGAMYVGDRSGTIFKVRDGEAMALAILPPSVAAFHLAMSPEGELFVSAPTLGSYDHIYRIARDGEVRTMSTSLGRPQGLAFSLDGALHVVDALAGGTAVHRFATPDSPPEIVVSGGSLVGLAFGPSGELVVSSNETAYRFD